MAVSSPREAELAKLIENTFRHVNIALVNELAMFAHDLGIDVWEAIDAASTKPFGFMPFTPGPGWAATACPSTRPTCPGGWSGRSASSFRFVELANDINSHMPDYVVRRIMLLALNERGRPVRGCPHPAARAGLQEEHRRRAGVARRAGRRAAAPRWAREVRAADPQWSRAPPAGRGGARVDATPEEIASGRHRASCSPTTTPSTATTIGQPRALRARLPPGAVRPERRDALRATLDAGHLRSRRPAQLT